MKATAEILYRVVLKWTQKGHTLFDPTGQRDFHLQASWIVCGEDELIDQITAARDYAEAQDHWTSFEVFRELVRRRTL